MKNYSENLSPSNLLGILVVLLIVNLAIHIPFLITDYFGESDSAVIANGSIKAIYLGFDKIFGTQVYSTPLYSDFLRFLLKNKVISSSDIPFWMASVSAISSAIITMTMFIFVLRLTSSILSALCASLILQLIPAFWFNSIYGFPTIVAIALFMVSLILFQSILDYWATKFKYPLLFLALLFYVFAVMTKVDVLLASAIYCLPLWRSSISKRSKIIYSVCIAIIPIFVFILFNQYALSLLRASHNTALNLSEWNRWNSRFPPFLKIFFGRENLITTVEAFGILSIPTTFISVLLLVRNKEWRSSIFWLIMACLPPVFFWGIRPGNSARHILISSLFLCILLVLPLTMQTWKKGWLIVLAYMCFVNYFYFPPNNSPDITSGRLLASTHLFENYVKNCHDYGKMIAQLPYKNIAVIGEGHEQMYYQFEVLRSSQFSFINHYWQDIDGLKVYTFEMQEKNKPRLFLWLTQGADKSHIVSLSERGYFLIICDRETEETLKNLPQLKGKWILLH